MADHAARLTAALADSYRIERKLGAGGMATVYLAHDLKHDRPVAIKVVHPEIAAVLGPERFLREIRVTAQLNHPHILPLLDSGSADGLLFYAMPYVAEESLRDRLTREKQLPVDDALQITREIADAIGSAHSRGFVHRDIKPENILLEEGHAVIADFGIARAVGAAGGARLTETGASLGTPQYMSPEQSSGDVDGRSDIYSLGCVLYEMLAGEAPFAGPTAESVLRQHLLTPPRPITEIRPTVSAGVARALDKALAKTPADRFATGAQFRDALAAESVRVASMVPSSVGRRGIPLVAIVAVLAVFIGGGLGLWWRVATKGSAPSAPDRPMLVVLPFENLGTPEDDYFADGITDAITARLAGVAGLGVISRTSAVQYRDMTPRQIAAEGVDFILEGTVQRERPSDPTSRVRIIPQLIDATSDTHVWAATFDDHMSEVFRLQSDIAEHVADTLQITLLEPERQSLTERFTDNVVAYELYLRSRRYGRANPEGSRLATQLLERAVDLDPDFVLAHVRLFYLHSGAYFFGLDRTDERRSQARAAVERAQELAPGHPTVERALGYYYYELAQDYELAEQHFVRAYRLLPNDADLMVTLGFVWRRQGRFDVAVEYLKQAVSLNPRSGGDAAQAGATLAALGEFAEADQYFDRAIAIAPNLQSTYVFKAISYMLWHGDAEEARAALERISGGDGPGLVLIVWAMVTRLDARYEELIARLLESPVQVVRSQTAMVPKTLLLADAYLAIGDSGLARAYFDSARTRLDTELANTPDDPRLHSSLGLAYAGLMRAEDAIGEGERGLELASLGRDFFAETTARQDLVRVLIMVGEYERALDHLEFLLNLPANPWLSRVYVQKDPIYAPLRNLPRFRRLLATKAS